jgi:hypothetical protein
VGETILAQKGLHTDKAWVWYGLLANVGITIVYLLATWLAMRHIEHQEPVSADASPEEAMSSLFSSASLRQPGSDRRVSSSSSSSSDDIGDEGSGGRGSSGMRSAHGSIPASIPEDEELKDDDYYNDDDDDDDDDDSLSSDGGPGAPAGPEGSTISTTSSTSSSAGPSAPAHAGAGGAAQGQGQGAVTFMTAPSATTVSTLTHQASDLSDDEGEGGHPSLLPRHGSSHWQLAAVSAIPFVPCALSFEDVWYSVPDPKGKNGEALDLLKGVSGFVTPSTMMALMGSSGAGASCVVVHERGCLIVVERGLPSERQWCTARNPNQPTHRIGSQNTKPNTKKQARRRCWTCWRGAKRAGPSRGTSSSTARGSTAACSRPSSATWCVLLWCRDSYIIVSLVGGTGAVNQTMDTCTL